jgi:6-phosphogluconolactonase/glucosamine-6-phosphate isomerase/deaminase
LGRNGHLALNEPGSPRSSTTRVVELAPTTAAGAVGYGARRRPTWGITVGLAELFGSREVWLLATGAHKAEIATRALTGPIGSDCPASFLQEHTNCRVMLDDAAAGPDLG